MRSTPAAALLALVLSQQLAGAGELHGPLASPMIDPGIFRDDQVHRFSGRYGQWTTVCDEVTALKRRYCSLRSAPATDSRGRGVFVDVSTGDDGRPAALLHLPLGLSLQPGVRITLAAAKSGKAGATNGKAGAAALEVPVALCTGSECQAIWSLDPARIRALNAGADLRVSYCTLRPGFSAFRPSLAAGGCESRSEAAIPGAGFKEAVLASVE